MDLRAKFRNSDCPILRHGSGHDNFHPAEFQRVQFLTSIVNRKRRVSSHRGIETRSTRSRENDSAPTVGARFSLAKFPPLELSRRKKLTGGDACAIAIISYRLCVCVRIYIFSYILYICIHIEYFCSRGHDPSTRIVLQRKNIELNREREVSYSRFAKISVFLS